jgi:RNA-binding protein YlmH
LGLRNKKTVNTASIGIRSLNFNHNNFGDIFATELSDQMITCDHYMKFLTVRFNNISKAGIDKLCMGVSGHKDYIGFDIRDNPGYN